MRNTQKQNRLLPPPRIRIEGRELRAERGRERARARNRDPQRERRMREWIEENDPFLHELLERFDGIVLRFRFINQNED